MKNILIIGGCGYIGSKLFLYLKEKNYPVQTVDLEWFGNVINPKNKKKDYLILTKKFLSSFDVIILLAGHSTVAMCENDVVGSFKNNIVNFVELLEKLQNQTLIYASSFRVYGDTGSKLTKEQGNPTALVKYYDLTKKIIDDYASLSGVNYFSLRMASVNGYSPNLRTTQMINQMYSDAIKYNKIRIYNPHAHRSILGINDFCHCIENIIEKKAKRGVYNIASFNGTIKEIGSKVSRLLEVSLEVKGSGVKKSSTLIDTGKFEKAFNFTFMDTVESIIKTLIDNNAKNAKIIAEDK